MRPIRRVAAGDDDGRDTGLVTWRAGGTHSCSQSTADNVVELLSLTMLLVPAAAAADDDDDDDDVDASAAFCA